MEKEYELVKGKMIHLVGLGIETDQEHGKEEIGGLWDLFLKEGVDLKIPKKRTRNIMVLYSDYDKNAKGSYHCLIGCEVKHLKKIPKGMMGKTLLPSCYARIKVKGSLAETWQSVQTLNLPRTFTGDFEVYSHTFRQEPIVEIFVAIKMA